MNVLTVIFSFNTPARTMRCYNELALFKPDWHEIVVLDNSRKDLVAQTPNTVWIGEENRGHGGMIDYVLKELLHGVPHMQGYSLVGMLNNDTYDYAPRFISKLTKAVEGVAEHRLGIVSPAVKKGGTVWPTMERQGSGVRPCNFIETIAPWYGPRLLRDMLQLCPMEYYGHIDRAISIRARQLGLQNLMVDSLEITHEAGRGRDELGTRQEYCERWRGSVKAWYDAHEEIRGLDEVWPEEINSTDWSTHNHATTPPPEQADGNPGNERPTGEDLAGQGSGQDPLDCVSPPAAGGLDTAAR